MNLRRGCYLTMTLEWDYNKVYKEQNMGLSMPEYIKQALINFKNHFIKQQLTASPYKDPIYGCKGQYAGIINILTFTTTTKANQSNTTMYL